MADERRPLEAKAVAKRYDQGSRVIDALRGVDLDVDAAEFVAVMGPSGSGKSTLLHAMAGLIAIDGGQIKVAGQDLSELSDDRLTRFRRKSIGLVFQAFNLIPSLSAEDNVLLPAQGADARDRAVQLLDALGMAERRRHKPGALSGGEQQRVAIARALVAEPAILFADEPTGSLDSVSGQDICRLLRGICDDRGATIVVVTHEPQVAMWADRVVVLRDGVNLTEFRTSGAHDPAEISAAYQTALSSEEQVRA